MAWVTAKSVVISGIYNYEIRSILISLGFNEDDKKPYHEKIMEIYSIKCGNCNKNYPSHSLSHIHLCPFCEIKNTIEDCNKIIQ